MIQDSLELDTITQNWLDTYSWYGTLSAIAINLDNPNKQIIEEGIALLENDLTVKQTLQNWQLKQILRSLLTNASASDRVKCAEDVERILQQLITDGFFPEEEVDSSDDLPASY